MNKINEHDDEIEKLQTAKGRVGDNAHQQEISITKMKLKLGKASESNVKKALLN